jgi:hypothetical protein
MFACVAATDGLLNAYHELLACLIVSLAMFEAKTSARGQSPKPGRSGKSPLPSDCSFAKITSLAPQTTVGTIVDPLCSQGFKVETNNIKIHGTENPKEATATQFNEGTY